MPAKKRTKKITLELPTDVLENALKHSQHGIAGTVRQALEIFSASVAYEKLHKLRGKVKFSLNVNALRDE